MPGGKQIGKKQVNSLSLGYSRDKRLVFKIVVLNQGRFCLASSLLPSHPHLERWAVSADILACHILGDATDTEGMETREAAKHPLGRKQPPQ